MKPPLLGTLKNTPHGWVVLYSVINSLRSLPLHPKYEKYYFLDKEDADGSAVEFEIVKEYIDEHTNQVQTYAKLIKNK
jgi:hypothetical protein